MRKILVLVIALLTVGTGLYLWKGEALFERGFLTSLLPSSQKDPFETELIRFVPPDAVAITSCTSDIVRFREYWNADSYRRFGALLKDKSRVESLIRYFLPPQPSEIDPAVIAESISTIATRVLESEAIKTQFEIEGYVQFQGPGAIASNGFYGILSRPIDYQKDLQALVAAGVPIQRESFEGFDIYLMDYLELFKHYFTVELPTEDLPPASLASLRMYFGYSGSRIALASSRELVVKFLKREPYQTAPQLLSQPEFVSARTSRPFDPRTDVCYSYIDMAGLVSSYATAINESAAHSDSDEAQAADLTEEIAKNFPVTGVIQTLGYDKSIYVSQYWRVNEAVIPEHVKPWLEALRPTQALHALEWLPDTAALGFALNGENIRKLKAVAQASPEGRATIEGMPQISLLDTLEGIGVAVLPPSAGVMWPDAVLVAKLDGAQSVIDLVQGQLSTVLEQGLGGGFKWQTKEIAGKTTTYFQTPLGVGLYMMGSGPVLATGSSESAIAATLPVVAEGKGSIASKIAEMKIPRATEALAAVYFDTPIFGRIARDVQASAIMFTGQSELLPEDVSIFFDVVGRLYFSAQVEQGSAVGVTIAHQPR